MKMKNIKVSAFLLILLISGCASMPETVDAWRADLQFETIQGKTMAYKTYGNSKDPVVLLLHGLPTSSYLYRNIAPEVAKAGYYVVTPDFIGFGASSKPQDYVTYGIDNQAQLLNEFLRKLNINQFNLVVHDMGGLVAFEILASAPEKIDSLLVLNTTAYEDFTPPKAMKMMAGSMGGMMGFMMTNGVTGKALVSKFIKDNMGKPDKLDDMAKQNYWWPIREGNAVPMRAIAKSMPKLIEQFPRYQSALKKYQGPSRILWGAKDTVLDHETLTPLFSRDLRISKDRVIIAKDAGHFIPEDSPKAVTDSILRLLKDD